MPKYYTKCLEILTKSRHQITLGGTSYGTNLQYDQFQNTKQVLKAVQHDHEDRIKNTLLSQGLVISSILKYSCLRTASILSIVQQNMPRNIFNFSIKYLSNTLPTRKNRVTRKVTQRRIIMKTINIAIRSTYYIFCQRNKLWNNPELLNF